MTKISYDSFNEKVEEKNAPLVIEGWPGGDVTFISYGMLEKETRKQLKTLIKQISGEDPLETDEVNACMQIITLIADSVQDSERVMTVAGDKVGVYLGLIETYMGQDGELKKD